MSVKDFVEEALESETLAGNVLELYTRATTVTPVTSGSEQGP